MRRIEGHNSRGGGGRAAEKKDQEESRVRGGFGKTARTRFFHFFYFLLFSLLEGLDAGLEIGLVGVELERLFPGHERVGGTAGAEIAFADGVEDGDVGSEMVQVALIVFDGRGQLTEGLAGLAGELEEVPLALIDQERGDDALDSEVILGGQKKTGEIEGIFGLGRIAPVSGFEQRPGLGRIIVVQILEAQDVITEASLESGWGWDSTNGRGRLIMLVI